jgi:predicted enzyme related to lactoylglutathione lyase
MTDAAIATADKPVWADLSTTDPAAAREFYTKVFGWQVEVNPDPQYGGYGLAKVGGHDAAGIGGTQSPDQPAAWSVYIGSDDADALAQRVAAAGGTVIAPPFPVGDQGRMAVFQDPTGAFISAWEADQMPGAQASGSGTFGWAELNDREVDAALPFYQQVFGWAPRHSGEGAQRYTEFQLGGQSIAGAVEMNPMVPDQVPNHWLVYFAVDDVDATHRAAVEAGATEMLAPADFNGGRFAILGDPQGAAFGLLRLADQRG